MAPENLNEIDRTLFGMQGKVVCLGKFEDLQPLDLDFIDKLDLDIHFMDTLLEQIPKSMHKKRDLINKIDEQRAKALFNNYVNFF